MTICEILGREAEIFDCLACDYCLPPGERKNGRICRYYDTEGGNQ